MRELYRQTFSQVHSSSEIRWEDMEEMKPKKKISKNVWVLAAVVALLAALSTVAGKQEVTMPVDPETGTQEVQTVDMISLSGYMNTPEGRATAEWQEFLNSYDQDGAILNEIGNDPTGLDERYDLYLVYTREMADKLDEIVEKYGLKLHTELMDAYQ